MSDIEEMDSERLNELESILYASIHYNDASSEVQQQMDAQSMPPPLLQQNEQQHPLRIVSNKRVVNNATAKPRYWTENKSVTETVNRAGQAETSLSTSAEDTTTTDSSSVTPASPVTPKAPLTPKAPVTPKASVTPAAAATPKAPATPKNKRPELSSPKKAAALRKQPKEASLSTAQKLLLQQQQQKLLQQKQQQKQLAVQKKNQQQAQKPPKPQATPQLATKIISNYEEPERFDQRLLVAIPSNWPVVKHEPIKRGVEPFGKASRKLEQFQKLEQKRQKSKRAQLNKKANKQINAQPIEVISLVESEKSSDADDVVIVPLPPVPIIDVDASDEEKEKEDKAVDTNPYMEENAMDAADVNLSVQCGAEQDQELGQEQETVFSALHSPCSSVLSSDDFIVQNDCSRLLAEHARATDEDLLVLTANAIRDAAEPTVGQQETEQEQDQDQAADTSSEYEFVPPSRLEEIKQNYRVDEQQFRALDVYESESDLTESGIYCKAKPKATPTIIRNIDSASDSSDVEYVVEPNVQKTKRLRKRVASTNQSQSDPNNEGERDNDDTDSDDSYNQQATGVPGIARGMAVERCKRKIRRISQRRSSESAVTAQPRKIEEENDASSDSAAEESLPTARQIAERMLRQAELKQKAQDQAQQDDAQRDDESIGSIGSEANTEDEVEMQDAMTERISAVFKRIDGNTISAKRRQALEEQMVSTTEPDPEIVEENVEENEFEMNTSEEKNEEPQAELQAESQLASGEVAVLQVEHNVTELKDELRGGDLVGWNNEMCRFYNDSWQGEQFNLFRIQRAMSGNRNEWQISNADRYPAVRRRSNLKCTNCFEMGHIRAKCPRPRKATTCYTCGMSGHAEPRCPNAICLGCGIKQSLYVQKCNKCSFYSRMVCQLCKMRGHCTENCPDKWRRYHSTTRMNSLLEGNVQYRMKHCSYCAGRGHLFEECRQRMGEFRQTNYTAQIMSHQKTYKDRNGPISYLTDLRFFFDIDTPFYFKWSSEFSKNSSYARFLKVVGLARPADKRKKPTAALMPKGNTNAYVPNPQATAARTSSVTIEELPAAMQDKAEPAVAVATTSTVVAATAAADAPSSQQIQQKEISSNFQSKPAEAKIATKASQSKPKDAKTTRKASSTVVSPGNNKSTVTPHDLDSDSNYSFSEHFELPSSTTPSDENEHNQSANKTGPMDNLPEMIPLSTRDDDDDEDTDNDDNNEGDLNISSISQGISMCINSKATSSTSTTTQQDSLPDVPSEAKILMARDQTEYLFSPEGREFLTETAKSCNVNVRMDFKEYGYVLVIYGLKQNQEQLQLMLLRRNQEVKRKSSEFQSQKPPKRIDVLIRFMRDGINSLTSDLGNAKNHYFRIKELERMNTKSGYKAAERKRRLLNMILFGQAGLNNGSMHLDQLLLILKQLVHEHAADGNASAIMRNDIEEHWRVIFSPHPHPNYEALLQSYAKLDVKNRLSMLDIEPALLGQQATRKPQLAQKRDRETSPPPPPVWMQEERAPPAPSMQQQQQKQQHQQQKQQQPQQHNNNGNNRTAKQRTMSNAKSQKLSLPPLPVWQHEEQQQLNNSNSKNRPPKQRPTPYPKSPGQQHQQQQQQRMLPTNNQQQQRMLPVNQQQRMLPILNQQQQQRMMPANNQQQQRMLPANNQQQQQRMLPINNQQQQRMLPASNQQQQQRMLPINNQQQQRMLPANNQQQERMLPINNQQQQRMLPANNQQQERMLPINNQLQRATAKLHLQSNRTLEPECVKLLAGMERESPSSTDASKPSMFWSRESLKYLDDLFKLAGNPSTLERLNRVLERSRRGQLSHNDYRAVIRLHSLMEPN